ncbi:type II secretion system protein M [Photobacterium sp. 53610]|uniref:type II secretion system protein M n=1 Tax=Photobacterium sp. 53610 TaxID=3102789 RepID=UPI002ED80007
MNQWFKSLTSREQRLVIGGGIALVIAVLYWGIWQPMALRAEHAENELKNQRQLLTWVSSKADDIIKRRAKTGASGSISPTGLNQVVNETTRRFRIELIRMQPQPRDESVQVWVQPLPFNTLVNWLAFLRDEHGIEAKFLDVSKTDQAGVVEVNRLQLGRG